MYKIEDIDDYQNKITDKQKQKLIKHCNRYNIKPNICAWYEDMEDFFLDWCDEVGYTKTQARKVYCGGKGEFCTFEDGSIVRLVL